MSADLGLFHLLGAVAVLCAALLLVVRSAAAASAALLAASSALAGILVLLGAEFVGVALLIVQAGVATVLLLMIFMLVGAEGGTRPSTRRLHIALKGVGCAAAAFVAVAMVGALPGDLLTDAAGAPAPAWGGGGGGHRAAGLALFRDHRLSLQAVGLVLLSAIVASISLVRRRSG